MRKRHMLNRATGSTMCGIREVSRQEKQFMKRDHWNKYITCAKCKAFVEHTH
jgi:hypothetical protein